MMPFSLGPHVVFPNRMMEVEVEVEIEVAAATVAVAAVASVMFDSVRPHRWQPPRLPRPWDSPGKNAGVGCHFLLQCM